MFFNRLIYLFILLSTLLFSGCGALLEVKKDNTISYGTQNIKVDKRFKYLGRVTTNHIALDSSPVNRIGNTTNLIYTYYLFVTVDEFKVVEEAFLVEKRTLASPNWNFINLPKSIDKQLTWTPKSEKAASTKVIDLIHGSGFSMGNSYVGRMFNGFFSTSLIKCSLYYINKDKIPDDTKDIEQYIRLKSIRSFRWQNDTERQPSTPKSTFTSYQHTSPNSHCIHLSGLNIDILLANEYEHFPSSQKTQSKPSGDIINSTDLFLLRDQTGLPVSGVLVETFTKRSGTYADPFANPQKFPIMRNIHGIPVFEGLYSVEIKTHKTLSTILKDESSLLPQKILAHTIVMRSPDGTSKTYITFSTSSRCLKTGETDLKTFREKAAKAYTLVPHLSR